MNIHNLRKKYHFALLLCIFFTVNVNTKINDSLVIQTIRERADSPDFAEATTIPVIDEIFTIETMLIEHIRDAIVWSLPYEINVGQNVIAPFETYILMISTEEKFIITFVCIDDDPSQIRATHTDRGRWNTRSDDAVGVYIDTFGEERNAYYLMLNARGVQYDAMRLDQGARGTYDDEALAFKWSSEVVHKEFGYVVQIGIPYEYLRTSRNNGILRWNIMPFRIIPREFVYKTIPFPWNYEMNCLICQYPEIEIKYERSLTPPVQLIPYTSAVYDRLNVDRDMHPSVGIDFKYQTNNWSFDGTILPDFSQIETDAFQMETNVRFLTRVEERRPFFMERGDLMRFPIGRSVYTRSILDPAFGLRWTGQIGAHNYSMMSLYDRSSWFLLPGAETSAQEVLEDYPSLNTYLRYRYDSSRSVLGLLVTSKEYADGYNRVLNTHGQFPIGDRYTISTQLIGSFTEYPPQITEIYRENTDDSIRGFGYYIRLNKPGRIWEYTISARGYGDGVITGLGVLERVGKNRVGASSMYHFRPQANYISRVGVGAQLIGVWRQSDGIPLNQEFEITVSADATSQTYLEARAVGRQEYFGETSFDLFDKHFQVATNIFSWYQTHISISAGDAIDYELVERMNFHSVMFENNLMLLNRSVQLSYAINYYNLFQEFDAQKAIINRLSILAQLTQSFGFRVIGQWRQFNWLDPRYRAEVSERLTTFQNQILLRYRIDFATVFYLGFYTMNQTVDNESRERMQIFAKFSYRL